MADFYITAFGPFAGVDVNPTEELLADLVSRHTSKPQGNCWNLLGTKVLPVAAKEVDEWLHNDLYGCILKDAADRPVVIHLGVDVEATSFQLETYAANEATFRVKDSSGWQPQKELIDAEQPLNRKLITDVPIRVVVGLLETRGLPVVQSFDAGRFVCNYTYYQSLRLAGSAPNLIHAIFIHVPPTTAMPLGQQKEVLWEVLRELAGVVSSTLEYGGSADLLDLVDLKRWPSVVRAARGE